MRKRNDKFEKGVQSQHEKQNEKIAELVSDLEKKRSLTDDEYKKKKITERLEQLTSEEFGVVSESRAFKEDLEANKPFIIKSIAYIYRAHNRLEESRSWFLRIITADRYSEEAQKAAIEIIGTYQITGDWENIRQEANRYLKYMVREGEENSQFAKDLRRYGAESDWMLAQTKQQEAQIFEEKQQTEAAAQAYAEAGKRFEAFYRDFVESKDRASALEQAAISYEKSGQTEYAAKLFQEYIKNYPSSESAPSYMEQIAKSYLSILEYKKALEDYQLLYNRTKADKKQIKFTKTALLNMAVLNVGTGEYRKAAKGFEDYAAKLSGKEKEEAYYLASKYWELVGDWQAKDYYQRYLKSFGSQNPAHAIEAQAKLIEIKKRIYPSEVEYETKRLESLYDKLVKDGNRDPDVHKYGAYTKIRKMDEQLKKLRKFKYIKKTDLETFPKNLIKVEENAKALDGILQGFCQELRKIPDLEALAASYYCEAQAIFLALDFRYEIPEPDDIDAFEEFIEDDTQPEELRERYRAILSRLEEGLDNIAEGNDKLEKLAYERLDKGLKRAKEKQYWSPWHTKMNALRHARNADTYDPDADEVLFYEGSKVEEDLLPYSPRGGLYGSQLESSQDTQEEKNTNENPEENSPPTEEENSPEDTSPKEESLDEDTPNDTVPEENKVPEEPSDDEEEDEEEEE